MQPMLTIAVKAARQAGTLINRAARSGGDQAFTRKRHNDFVTEVDKAAEAAIISTLQHAFPAHAILAEESGRHGEAEYLWIIDPLDGTTNFIHGFPQFAVSIGLQHKGVLTQAVIYDPWKNELFTASRGTGAFLNDKRIRVSKCTKLRDSLIGTGFPFRGDESLDEYIGMFRSMTTKTAGLRRAGAAALDLAYVACGRLDGFWEIGLSPWDIAAGALLVTEAGGMVADLQGGAGFLESGRVVAAAPKIFVPMMQALSPAGATSS
ncbi:MAG: inositol monophosphatase [Betaproteobacteria bacterium]|nr:inositol monophosphatase [Betaproteobacteria bacterium]